MALVLATALFTTACSAEPTAYEINDSEGYTLSVKFDAGDGMFSEQTKVITDTYNLEKLTADSSGNINISLLSPEDERRNTKAGSDGSVFIGKTGHYVKGWYEVREEAKDENGNTVYKYAEPWDFTADKLTVKKDGKYSATKPILTLYADYAPAPTLKFYDAGKLGDAPIELTFSPKDELTTPYWDEGSGKVVMGKFKQLGDTKGSFTFNGMYYDAEKTRPVEDKLVFEYAEDGTVKDMSLYVDWLEGEWFKISDATQLSKNASATGNYIISADLDFEGKIWPSAFINGEFGGTIMGEGGKTFTIKNITTDLNKSKTASGLFGTLGTKAVISNISFENATVTVTDIQKNGSNFGLFAGKINEGATLENVSLKNSTLLVPARISSGDYALGFIAGMGSANLATEGLNCQISGDNTAGMELKVDGDAITIVPAGEGNTEESAPEESSEVSE